jgi:hypothetical protein
MRQIALSQDVPESDILIENESATPIANLCVIKETILIPNNFKNVALVCISEVIRERNEYNLKMVLGPDFVSQVVIANSTYTPEKLLEIQTIEAKRLKECHNFYKGVVPGDHHKILKLAMDELDKNMNSQQL